MDLPLGILALPMLVSTAAATSTWLRVRRRKRTFAAVSSLVPRPAAAPASVRIHEALLPEVEVVSPVLLPKAATRAPIVVEEPPPPLTPRVERMIDDYVARALKMTGTQAAHRARSRVQTPVELAAKVATRLASELALQLEDSAPHDIADVTAHIISTLPVETLYELSRLLEIDPPGAEPDDDPVIDPPVAVGPVRLPTPIAWCDPTEPIARLPRARTPRGSRPPSYEPLDRADTAPNAPEAIEDEDTAPVLLRF